MKKITFNDKMSMLIQFIGDKKVLSADLQSFIANKFNVNFINAEKYIKSSRKHKLIEKISFNNRRCFIKGKKA